MTEVFGACASAGFFRRAALLRAGSFPEHFRAYYDDVDLAFRLRWNGYRCLYTPHSRVFHRLNYSHNHRNASLIEQLARNEERVFWSNLPAPLLRRGVVPHLVFVAYCAGTRMLRRDNSRAYLRGKLSVLGELAEIRRQRDRLSRLARNATGPLRWPVETAFAPLALRFFSPSWA